MLTKLIFEFQSAKIESLVPTLKNYFQEYFELLKTQKITEI
jgi:hypothetical protein